MSITENQMSNAIRFLAMDAVQAANSGHPGLPMGAADVATVLFNRFINIDPSNPTWANRDRFILSAGHGSMLLYAIHHLLGYEDMPIEELKNFRQWGARTAGHPEYGHAKGIETTTGPLGQGIANAVGMALGERLMNARFGDAIKHYTYVLAGDGCLMEGISHEAIDMAGHLGLGSLIVFWDDNKITIDGDTDVATSMSQKLRFEAAGWHVLEVDGHDHDAIAKGIEAAQSETDKPTMIACRTIIGFGAPNKQGGHNVHGAPLGDEEIAAARAHLNWTHGPFEIPSDIKSAWEAIAARGNSTHDAWKKDNDNNDINDFLKGIDQNSLQKAMAKYREKLVSEQPKVASRKASQMALEVINEATPNTIGGSADLTGSNLTNTSQTLPVKSDDFSGRYVYYGVREHAMASVMNGLSLYGGFVPYGGTFLVFADYMRGAMRLSALMGQKVVYVLTHDSIGLGEDGPTHQPVETIAGLRALPNMYVFRPADVVETAEAWEIALGLEATPSILALSRQGLPCLRQDASMRSDKGAYVLKGDQDMRDVTLVATGSEVELAVQAAEILEAEGVKVAVVSAPCFELFAAQSEEYRSAVLGQAPRVGVEAAVSQGWDLMLRHKDEFVGMTSFGASAPASELYQQFGITKENIASAARRVMKG